MRLFPPIHDFSPFSPLRVVAIRERRDTLWSEPPPDKKKRAPSGSKRSSPVDKISHLLPPGMDANTKALFVQALKKKGLL